MNAATSKLSFAYFGTPRFAALALDELEKAGLVPELIVTAPDRPAGRGLVPTAPAVKVWAQEHGIPFIQPESLSEIPAELMQKKYDVFVIAAYGVILRSNILSLPAHGCVNLHPSLLPRFRGASPIESQILADEQPIGVSVMQMDEHMDTGPIIAQREVHPSEWPMAREALTDLLARENGKLAAEVLPEYVAGTIMPQPQNDALATYTSKIEKSAGALDLAADPRANYLKYLAYEGRPGTYFFARKSDQLIRVKITKAHYDGAFVIDRVIPEGKAEMDFADFAKTATI